MVRVAPLSDGTVSPAWASWYQSVSKALSTAGNTYTVATLPAYAHEGQAAFAANGRKSGETQGNGTGVPVWWDGSAWRTHYDNTVVSA